ncbi:MAG: amino acid permease, partial [Longispora sp.]|nr:amino acid permease [Longispora sp. (in: high G+C Gram-positive bacteria)]
GALAIFNVLPGVEAPGLENLTAHGGFLPHGFNGVIIGLLAAVTAFAGMEVVTIAAAESPDPARAVARAVRTTVWRIGVFLIGSMAVVVTLLPWNDSEVGQSPYVAVLNRTGVPAAGQIMNVVVLFALVSAMNANVYTTSRMLFSLAERGEAPRFLAVVSRVSVPYRAVLASAAFGFVSVVLSIIWPDTIFQFMINSVGAVGLIVWGLIALSQLRLRRELQAQGPLAVRMWGFPYLSWITIAGIGAVLALMAHEPTTRSQVACTGLLAVSLWVIAAVRNRRASRTFTV